MNLFNPQRLIMNLFPLDDLSAKKYDDKNCPSHGREAKMVLLLIEAFTPSRQLFCSFLARLGSLGAFA